MSLPRWIERHAAFTPEKAALRFDDQTITYAGLNHRVNALARGLGQQLGIEHGDRIAFLGLNHPDMLALLFACARIGAILVPLNWRLAAPEHRLILADAEPKALVVEADFRAHVEAMGPPSARLVGIGFAAPGWTRLEDLLGDPDTVEARGHQDDSILIVYTSGTTGLPKGAVLTQGALLWNALNSQHMHDLTSADHVLTVLPLFHVGGLNIQTLPALHAGATVSLHRRFEPGATIAAIGRERPTLTVLVPATMRPILEHPAWPGADLSSLRMIATGSQIVPSALIEAFHGRGVPVAQVYGTTETAPIVAYQRRADALRSIGSAGKPALHGELRVVGEAGVAAPPGERGEILVRGPQVMTHYWRHPRATAEALRDGWFHTGDIGHLDAGGDLWIDARKDDLIKSGGERIYPAEIEDLLRASPGIRDVAVIGRPDPTWGEVPVAVVVASGARPVTLADIRGPLEGRIARFKQPKAVVLVDDLPRSALGKVLRYRLRETIG